MLIRYPDPPQESIEAARAGLAELSRVGRLRAVDQRELGAEDVELTRPHVVYAIGLDDLRNDTGLSAARPVAWRYLVEHSGAPIGLADVVTNAEGRHQLAQVNYGPFVLGTARAFAAVEALEDERTDTDVALLHVPALHVLALWVEPGEPNATIVPLAPAPSGIEPGRAYDATEFEQLLTERARGIDVSDDEQGS